VRRFPNRRLLVTFVLGALLEPLGHTAAYFLRYGPSQAWQLQSQGSHAYFPRVFSLSTISLTAALVLGLMVMISIRLILGNRHVSADGLRSTFLILALTQCALFGVQESVEALAVQMSPDLLSIAILAICVQLPLAALAAWLISWIRGYLQLAPDALRAVLAVRLAPRATGEVLRPQPLAARRADLRDQRWYRRRGPPRSI
jgi:hypothetical protein